ncbi:hypothetical protein HWQ46_26415 [Shewanella sp. D64]|uniref:hypothetical protein n=1 Tax=unclassified Shewanella TaxID=196818 RepID=UPI0022BA5351|nr:MULTISPECIES: hypothetical protein [unclassified Shewanella]MEC4729051.1 hypothetical protein [Shewanella sp. D64]MEC4737890.1 hypothetical protein [Shewanella sp. E94]WBJ93857.1 hypothetical protein HWQ47_18250 [Shewanella sp. MTB7]
MKKIIFILALLLGSTNMSYAGYNANMVGEVTAVMTYSSSLILFRLHNQPSSHPSCNKSYFAIATDVSDIATNRMLSRLLIAHTTKAPVNIGFDNAGSCGNGYIRVHRVG